MIWSREILVPKGEYVAPLAAVAELAALGVATGRAATTTGGLIAGVSRVLSMK
jgi:hypothetical protein